MELAWLDPADPSARDLADAVGVLSAARALDAPYLPDATVSGLVSRLRFGWDGDPAAFALVRDGDRAVAVLQVDLPLWDNTHLGFVDVTVDPDARRCGLGKAVFEAGTDRVRAAGRTLLLADSADDERAAAFAAATGLARATVEVHRRQHLKELDRAALRRLQDEAAARADGYDLRRYAGWTPDEALPAVVRLAGAINDAPTDDLELEDEVFSAARIRAFDIAHLAAGQRTYRLVAVHRSTGSPAGQTVVAVDGERPVLANQYDTSVVREHRGHRLGLLLKLAMIDWLSQAEPQVRTLDTFNAASNDHMVGINEQLGYRVLVRRAGWQRHL